MKSATLSMDALQDAVGRLPDNRLTASRRVALQHFSKHGMPTTRDEDWKYTDLAHIVDIGNRWLEEKDDYSQPSNIDKFVNKICSSIDADWLVICRGQIDAQSINAFDLAGVDVERLSESDDKLQFAAPLGDLNIALLHDGLRLRVSDTAELRRPIGILLVDHATSAAGMTQARIEIDIADQARASFVEYHVSTGSADHYLNSVVNLALGDGAHASYVRIQERQQHHNQTSRLAVTLGRDSVFDHCGFDLGGRLVRNDLEIDIAMPGSRSTFNGLYLVGEQQHIDNHTRVNHRVGPAQSQQEYRGILTGKARGIWNGKAIVHAGADGSDAQQANHNLLLSDKAEIDAKPELEIYADDVKCSHGTTVGQLDEPSLFYLRTRGLSKHEAKQVLTRAFAQAIVSKAPIASIHDLLAEKIAERLGQLMHGANS
jgi:Fe-S cluster assembly protein SufD